jgi:DNA-directed RNA polymerase specialized sigma54-like protein
MKAFDWHGIRDQIREWIQSEDPRNPLTDQTLVREFAKLGIKVYDQQVSFCRLGLDIARASARRQEYKARGQTKTGHARRQSCRHKLSAYGSL